MVLFELVGFPKNDVIVYTLITAICPDPFLGQSLAISLKRDGASRGAIGLHLLVSLVSSEEN
jgi:hypothetical protein